MASECIPSQGYHAFGMPWDALGCRTGSEDTKKMCSLINIQVEEHEVIITGTPEACENGLKFLQAQIQQLDQRKRGNTGGFLVVEIRRYRMSFTWIGIFMPQNFGYTYRLTWSFPCVLLFQVFFPVVRSCSIKFWPLNPSSSKTTSHWLLVQLVDDNCNSWFL